MEDDTTIIPFHRLDRVTAPPREIVRGGARGMLAEALKAKADAFVASFADEASADGRQRMARHGRGPEKPILAGIGALDVRRPKMRDRAGDVLTDRASASPRTPCRDGRGGRAASMLPPALYRPATSRRR